MKAAVSNRYGGPEVLQVEDVPKPVPAADEVLVRVRATGVTRGDAHQRAGDPFISRLVSRAPFRPRRQILGHEFAGEVEAVGADVTEFAPGDRVFAALPYLAIETGAHAEYIAVPGRYPLVPMPEGLSFEEAGAVADGALLTLNCLRPAGDLAGKRLLVFGGSGAIGTATIQLAKHFGAHVTAVCKPEALELARSLGADVVIDSTAEDFTARGETWDVIVDAVGKHHPYSFRRCKRVLNPGGAYLPTDGLWNFALWLVHRRFGDRKVQFELPPRMRKEDLLFLKRLIEAGEYRPVIDRTYPFEDIAKAHRYVDTGRKNGNVVLTLTEGGN